MWVLEASDTGIRLSKDGEILYDEPGVALVEKNALTFGYEAMRQCKIHPSLEQSQYWQSLSQGPVHPEGMGVRTQADLVYHQLQEIKDRCDLAANDPLWVAVPADVSEAQLSLLYGIALQIGIRIADFVDCGVAYAAGLGLESSCVFLDVGLHRTVLSEVEIQSSATRGHVSVVQQSGRASLANTWIKFVSERFLDKSRFDPRKFGDAEQQVFDQVNWLVDSQERVASLRTSHGKNEHQVEILEDELADASRERYEQIISNLESGERVLLSTSSLSLPGFRSLLEEEGHLCHEGHVRHLITGIARLGTTSTGTSEERKLHREIQLRRGEGESKILNATHILSHAQAHPLRSRYSPPVDSGDDGSFSIVRRTRGLFLLPNGSDSVRVNGEAVSKELLVKAGDEIHTSRGDYQLISVSDDG